MLVETELRRAVEADDPLALERLEDVTRPLALALCVELSAPRLAAALLRVGTSPNVETPEGEPLFLRAVATGQREIAELLVASGVDPLVRDREGSTALHLAASHRAYLLIPWLATLGLSTETRDRRGRTPLHVAAGGACPAAVEALLEARARSDVRDRDARTPLEAAIRAGEPLVISTLLRAGAPCSIDALHEAAERACPEAIERLGKLAPGTRFRHGRELLHLATRAHDARLVRYLLARGARVGSLDDERWTPLHHAVDEGDPEAVSVLLEAGADPGAVDREGRTPLHVLGLASTAELVALLLGAGAELHARDAHGLTPFERHLSHDLLGQLRALAPHYSPPPDEALGHGWTSTHFAASLGSAEAIAALAARGLLDERSDDGWTVLHQAAMLGEPGPIALLVAAGADLEARGAHHRTPLHVVTTSSGAQVLLAAGASRAARDAEGLTPMERARCLGLEALAELFSSADAAPA